MISNMRASSIFLLLFFCATKVFSQTPTDKQIKRHREKVAQSKTEGTVIRSLDTIYNSGIPYAVLKSKDMFNTGYNLFSLNGTELIEIRWECTEDKEDCYYIFVFLQSGKRAEVGNFFGLRVEKLIVENNLVNDSAINAEGETKFLTKYPPELSNKTKQPEVNTNTGGAGTVANPYETVERNRLSTIQVFGSEIKQDFKVIGTYSKKSASGQGKILNVIAIYLPNGTKIAEATQEDTNSKSYRIVTMKDNKTHSVTVKYFGQEVEDIAKYLSDNYYL